MTVGKLIYWILWELLMTLSNKQSVFSSKKIERFFSFGSFLLISNTYYWLRVTKYISNETLSVEEVSMICALLLGHGVYSMIMNAKDKKAEQPKDNNDKNKDDATEAI